MAQPEKTEPLPVRVDADVLIAGLLSRKGASHVILVLGELGLLRFGAPRGRDALRGIPPLRPTPDSPSDIARELAYAKHVPILAAAISAGGRLFVTHNVRHFRSGQGVRVVRPRTLIKEVRAWVGSFGM